LDAFLRFYGVSVFVGNFLGIPELSFEIRIFPCDVLR
jgi:hypothetical protein